MPVERVRRGLVAVEQLRPGTPPASAELAGGLARPRYVSPGLDDGGRPRAPRRCRTAPRRGCRHPWRRGRRVRRRGRQRARPRPEEFCDGPSTRPFRPLREAGRCARQPCPTSAVPRSRTVGTSEAGAYGVLAELERLGRPSRLSGQGLGRRSGADPRCRAATDAQGQHVGRGGDVVLGLAHHDVALELEAGRELPALLGPLVGQDRNLRIDSALETALLASSTALSISARRSGSSTRSAILRGLAVLLGPGRRRPRGRG